MGKGAVLSGCAGQLGSFAAQNSNQIIPWSLRNKLQDKKPQAFCQGAAAYFLPEKNDEKGKIYADTVIDGEVTELKTVSGSRTTLGTDFRQGYHQGAALVKGRTNTEKHSVFIRLLSDLEIDSVRAKIAGELKNRSGKGHFICYFEHTGKLHTWSYDELRSIIGK